MHTSPPQVRRTSFVPLLGLLLLSLALLACQPSPRRVHYEAIDVKGWERNDTLHFRFDSLTQGGIYSSSLHLRHLAAARYPYRQLTLLVQQQWTLAATPHGAPRNPKGRPFYWPQLHPKQQPSTALSDSLIASRSDTLRLHIDTPHAPLQLKGLTLHSLMQDLPPLSLPKGAKGEITVRHLMDRESLPGLHDLGIELLPH